MRVIKYDPAVFEMAGRRGTVTSWRFRSPDARNVDPFTVLTEATTISTVTLARSVLVDLFQKSF